MAQSSKVYNHGIGDATCPRCSAHFKRPDLLERHLNRHRQKDAEAGGEGAGVLNTRKRSWRAPDGSVVPKKPATESEQPPTEQAAHQNRSGTTSFAQDSYTEGPISPPASTSNSEVGQYQDFQHQEQHDDSNLLLDGSSWSVPIEDAQSNIQENFWIDPGLLPHIAAPSQGFLLPYEEIFQPDTASSFNMPYTTAANYNWLFEQNNNNVFETLANQCAMEIDSGLPSHVAQQGIYMDLDPTQSSQDRNPPEHTMPGNKRRSEYPRVLTPNNSISGSMHCSEKNKNLTPSEGHPNNGASTGSHTKQTSPTEVSFSSSRGTDLERPLSTLKPPTNLPVIQDDARDRIVEIIDVAQPIVPFGGPFSAWDHPLLNLSALQEYLDLFFTKFNTTYPLIHCGTFDTSQTEPLLLLSVILLGATYSNRDAHQLAVCIHDVVRPQIFAHAGFSTKPELWVLQTILLVECFGKSRAGQKQHDMSHLFHGLLINLIRRSDCQTIQTAQFREPPKEEKDLETHWRRWAESEEKKRLALLCFMWDTQHAVLFCQSLCMSAFELRLSMPCNQALWEAKDESTWQNAQIAEPHPEIPYLTALKSYLFNPGSQRPTKLNSLSRILVLHGLMSIAWDLERRDQTALGVVSFVGGVNWRNRLGDAYDLWKLDFDAYCSEFVIKQRQHSQAPSDEPVDWNAARREFATFSTAYNAVYHAAHILLTSSFLDVQIYAGSRHILGRPIRRGDYIRSEKVIKRWVTYAEAPGSTSRGGSPIPSHDEVVPGAAAKAAYHAACMLRDASTNLDDFDSMGIFHVPWCLYLAALTLWAFHHARPSRRGGNEDDTSEMVWDARKEMDELLLSMTAVKAWNIGTNQTCRSPLGLVWVLAEALGKVRWGIVHSGVQVLRALVPMRLIGHYEDRNE
ncbi:fungal-specific transcription factor domain-containing protein [Truncatella angustata]|uniref:Fungal-specific transcription factor domain-containing protein n=1 Tax=Truncatella angustata TaxID=152316 RepID=A0A9P8ZWS3_9PEZI|nr:fungal-specific transcription factor domain-containing protein [Truncatella angustata]KAH6654047.1 fungal-specific transcription factor domain-containing protein [Truncatella angustata]